MLRSYIRLAWRNLFKNRLYSLINIAGLTLGLSIGTLVLLWVKDEWSFDRFHKNAARIYRVNAHIGTGSSKQVWNSTQAPVAPYALKEVPGVVQAVRIHEDDDYTLLSYKDKDFRFANAVYADPGLFTMFDFPLLEGSREKPFPNDQSVVITQSTAKKYFGDDDPLGKTLLGDHKTPYTVTGVVADFPDNSSIHADLFFSMGLTAQWYDGKGFWKSRDEDWGNFGYTTFLEIQPGTSLSMIGDQLIRIQVKHAPWIKVSLADNPFELQPLTRIHLYQADGSATAMETVRVLFAVGLLLLLIACINYVNLSTARALVRAKEVGVRKAIGAVKRQLFVQFFVETFLLFGMSLISAFVLIELLLPYYNRLLGKHLHFSGVWGITGLAVAGTLLASAVYPALLLSSFEPVKALKGKLSLGIANAAFRKGLVTAQFVFSVILIISMLTIGRQMDYVMQKDPGYDRAQVFTFQAGDMYEHLDAVEGELSAQPGILSVTTANTQLTNGTHSHTGDVDWDGKDPRASFIISQLGVDATFIPTLKMKLIKGKNFTGAKTDSAHFILNETAVRQAGIEDPIGKRFKLHEVNGTIIGVIQDYNFSSLKDPIGPVAIFYYPYNNLVYVKTTGKDAARAIAGTERIWKRYNAGYPFEYTFLDDDYAKLYKTEQRTGTLISVFSLIAVLISCLGLFGLATYSAQVRTKEIGIRKVLGASVSGIVSLISADFLKLILLAVLIAIPAAWWLMNAWLQNFAYRIPMPWLVFPLATVLALLLAIVTISFQAIRAAVANPVESLRTE